MSVDKNAEDLVNSLYAVMAEQRTQQAANNFYAYLYEVLVPTLRGIAMKIVGSDGEDVVQAALTNFGRIRIGSIDNVVAYLVCTTRNIALNTKKRGARVERHELLLTNTSADIADPAGTPEQQAIDNERRTRLDIAIQRLTPGVQDAIRLELLGYGVEETATRLHISLHAARRRRNRGRNALRQDGSLRDLREGLR